MTADNDPVVQPDQALDNLRIAHADCLLALAAAQRAAEESATHARIAQDEMQFFIYAASHDLQQPLRAIGTHAQLLQREYPNDERARELTSVIIDGATQMNTLLRDLLTYSRTGNVCRKATVNLNAPLQWARYNLASAIQESGANVVSSDLPEALADEKQIVTVFEHLLDNSIKFRGSEPPQVVIESETDNEFHSISIRDNGVGIKPEYQEKVFEPFKRLHSKDIPGSGLGLAVCRKILRAHHGRIWVESDGEHGSTFTFTLPL